MIRGLFDKGALPTLERVVQFTAQRHIVLTDNIANLSTVGYRPRDLNPDSFQASLRRAIDERRSRRNAVAGPLEPRDTRHVRFEKDRIVALPRPVNNNVLFHDDNNRDLERTMQALAENTLVHNASLQMIANQFEVMRVAIRERL